MNRTHGGATIFVSIIVFVVGMFVGFKLLTASADTFDAAPTCENRTVAEGEKLTSNLVTVNVYNASQRAGLANRVGINLQRRGFLGRHRGQQHQRGQARRRRDPHRRP